MDRYPDEAAKADVESTARSSAWLAGHRELAPKESHAAAQPTGAEDEQVMHDDGDCEPLP